MKQLYILLFSLLPFVAQSQEAQLAEQFFDKNQATTARSMGLAGAFGSVGADFSNATHNPAGIAMFRKKELGLGIGYQEQTNATSYLQSETTAKQSSVRLNNIGFVYSNLQTEWIGDSLAVKRQGMVSWAIAGGMNQMAEWNEQIEYSGFNSQNSILSSYVESANQFASASLSDLDVFEQQALTTNLLNYSESNGNYNYSSEIQGGNVMQNGTISREGARRDYYIGGGINYSNKLYVGATIGIPSVNYTVNDIFSETDSENNYSNFNSLTLRDEDNFSGIGGYLGLGLTYRFTDFIRAGLNVKTPTTIELTRESRIETSSQLAGTGSASTANDYESTFNLRLPFEAGLQLVASHPEIGLLSIEGEFVDYSSTKIKYSDETGEFTKNADEFENSVKQFYGSAINFRAGAEARLLRDLRLRAGFAHQASPYQNEEDELGADYSQSTLAIGLGYRVVPLNLTLDLGYNYNQNGEWDADYVFQNQANSIIKEQQSHRVQLGISKRFNN